MAVRIKIFSDLLSSCRKNKNLKIFGAYGERYVKIIINKTGIGDLFYPVLVIIVALVYFPFVETSQHIYKSKVFDRTSVMLLQLREYCTRSQKLYQQY